jgi:hypothetical protein
MFVAYDLAECPAFSTYDEGGDSMRANALIKQNVDGLLRQRHQSRKDLAQWCRKSESWLSKIMNEERREFPMKYWDRIADFFGLSAYQLLQPGRSTQSERRSGLDRRAGKDRRLSAVNHQVRESVSSLVANLQPSDVADLIRLKALSAESRDVLRANAQALETSERQAAGRTRRRSPAGTAATASTPPGARGSRQKSEKGA